MNIHLSFLYLSFLAFVLFTISGCSEPEPPPPLPKLVKTIQLGSQSQLSQRAFPGRAKAEHEVTLSFRVRGQLIERPVNVGDKVSQGDLLAKLDPVNLENTLHVAVGELAKAKAASVDAVADYKRAKSVQDEDSGAISQQAVDRAKAMQEATLALTSSAEAAVRIAEERLSYSQLTAPFDGEVVATYVESYETIRAKQPIIRLLNRDSIEFTIDIPENLIGYVGDIVTIDVRFDVAPEVSIPAVIKEVSRETSRSTRTYPVTLLLKKSEQFEVLPGMAGKAHIQADIAKIEGDAYQVPAAALFTSMDGKASYLWVIENNTLVKREVEVGLPSDYGIRIKSGLKEGDWIVVAGVNSLKEGQPVRKLDVSKK